MTSQNKAPVIIFCVLNWGLGHATRSIPIICSLIERGYRVVLASDGRAGYLLKNEFPELDYFELHGYKVKYPFKSMFLNLLIQWPRVVLAMIREHFQVARKVNEHKAVAIISDNRYGCYHRSTINVCITHQINPLTNNSVINLPGRWVSRFFLSNFQLVWMPDDPQMGPLNGYMVEDAPDHARFIGFISRFEASVSPTDKLYDVLAIISGPEPARSRFESSIIRQLVDSRLSFRIVRGITEGFQKWHKISERGYSIDYLTSENLRTHLEQSQFVVSRSGYTSLMDYIIMGARAIVVPTPGQYEQEYLAYHLPADGQMIGQLEDDLDIVKGCEQLRHASHHHYERTHLLEEALDELRDRLGSKYPALLM